MTAHDMSILMNKVMVVSLEEDADWIVQILGSESFTRWLIGHKVPFALFTHCS